MSHPIVTAAILVIGDEILSGRTKDKNIGHIAEVLTRIGIRLDEVRIVGDEIDTIVDALNALRTRVDYVFTTGGIGPTHDDITADAVAKAFGVALPYDQRAIDILKARYPDRDLNDARMRMTRVPEGGELVPNPVSGAPGFRIGNVFVMAGIPSVMQAMLDQIVPMLRTGTVIESRSYSSRAREGDIAARLGQLQERFPDLMFGSYPGIDEGGFKTTVVVRGPAGDALDRAAGEVARLMSKYDGIS